MTAEIGFPESEKLAKVTSKMRLIEEFIDWASMREYVFGREVESSSTFGPPTWLATISRPQMERLLHQFFEIDTEEIHKEREQMYQAMKAASKAADRT